MRFTLCATLAIAALGCETKLDGGGNGGGGDGGGPVASSGDPTDASTAADTTGATSGITGVTSSSSGGGAASCPPAEGLPEAQPFHSEPRLIALGVTGDHVVAATEEQSDHEATFVRLAKDDGAVVERATIDGWLATFLEHEGVLLGGGHCMGGGTPFVIGDGPTFAPIAPGCPDNPTTSLAVTGDEVAYENDNRVLAAARDGAGEPRVLAELLPIAPNEIFPIVSDLAADATDVYAAVLRVELSPDVSWGEVWRIPLAGGLPERLVENEHVSAVGSLFGGGIQAVVLDDEHVIFSEWAKGRVSRVPKSGGPVEILWDGEHQIRNLVRVGAEVGFIEESSLDLGGPSCDSIIRMMPLGEGDATPVARIRGFAGDMVTDGTTFYLTAATEADDGSLTAAIVRAAAARP